jgi:Cytochrome P450
MAVFEILHIVHANPAGLILGFMITFFICRSFYRIFLHPIAHIPGPLLPRITSLWLYYHAYIGDEASVIHALHKTYGPFVRVTPNQVDIGDADAIQPIYVAGGGFLKAECYANFDIDGHKTIFSTVDPAYRVRRAKAVQPLFSTASIRSNSLSLYGCIDRMIARMESEASSRRPVNILNLTRSLAVDVVSMHLFQLNYNGTEEKTERLSVSAFVDAFVAVGRFFYAPTWAFPWLEWASEKITPGEQTMRSMEIVNKFVNTLVAQTTKESSNYPGKLMEINLEKDEIRSQCKDLIFAGTDATGMNLAMICRYLALNPEKLVELLLDLILPL